MANSLVVVMGVTGSGKSTVGCLLARRTGVPFLEGDEYHDVIAVAAMTRGRPLDDDARAPWLRRLRGELLRHRATGAVLACSCLKACYRAVLAENLPEARFVLLHVSDEVLVRRLQLRQDHFAGLDLLPSQLGALEITDDVIVVDAEGPATEVVARIRAALAPATCGGR